MKDTEHPTGPSEPPKTLKDALDELEANGWADAVKAQRARMLAVQGQFIRALTSEDFPNNSKRP